MAFLSKVGIFKQISQYFFSVYLRYLTLSQLPLGCFLFFPLYSAEIVIIYNISTEGPFLRSLRSKKFNLFALIGDLKFLS